MTSSARRDPRGARERGKENIGLAAILGQYSKNRFLREIWPEQFLHIRSRDQDRLTRLLGVPALRNFASLSKAWRYEAFVLPTVGGDEYLAETVKGRRIARKYRAGRPMFLHQPDRQFPLLRRWIRQLRWDLAVPTNSYLKCSTHATPGGTSTEWHFDDAASFVLQLSGKKTWLLAPNKTVPFPTSRFSRVMPSMSGDLLDYQADALPSGNPSEVKEINLTAGSVLFVPSGWWHATRSVEPSLALMFIVKHVNWADVVLRALKIRLLRGKHWRRYAVGGRSPSRVMRNRGRAAAADLAKGLRSAVAALSVREIVEPSYYRCCDGEYKQVGKSLRFVGSKFSAMVHFGNREREIFKAVLEHKGRFFESDVTRPGFSQAQVSAVLATLCEIGFLAIE